MALNLSKGQTVVVKKDSGQSVVNLTVGANWGMIDRNPIKKTGIGLFDRFAKKVSAKAGTLEAVDLDLTIITFDAAGNELEECAFYNKNSFSGLIKHSGDDRGGDEEDDGLDNERIQFQGLKVATQTKVQSAFIVLNSYSHQTFDEIPYVRLGIYDGLYNLSDKAPRLLEFDLTNDAQFKGSESFILAVLNKTSAGWELSAIGQATADKSIRDIKARIKREHI